MKLLLGLVFGLITTTTLSFVQDKQNLKIYPEPKEGFQPSVIQLTPKKNEEAYKVEIMVGKMMKADCNRQNLMGKFELRACLSLSSKFEWALIKMFFKRKVNF
ncbi:hypothetical protein H7F33_11455 [Pedobacter sp. PAMC26386]|nr:hypothetical protein H7F33_11455 [Pedobacter sp. PAMC26386]